MKLKFAALSLAAAMAAVCLSGATLAQQPLQLGLQQLSWAAATENDDGTPLTDLMGYYIYWGRAADQLTVMYFAPPNLTAMMLPHLSFGTSYYAITAVNYDGVESQLTPLVSSSAY